MFFAISFATANAQTEIFKETFSGCSSTGGNDNQWSGGIASGTFVDGKSSDNTGWTLTKGYAANGCIRLGGSSNPLGSAVTPAFSNLNGDATLYFDAGAWNSSKENTTLNVKVSEGYFDAEKTSTSTTVTMTKGKFNTFIPNRSLENPFRGQARKHLIISMMKIAFSNDRH